MAKIDKTYHKLLKEILNKGYDYEDPNRKDVFRCQISDYTIYHDFKDGFPALTTKKLAWKSVVGELLWILRGDTNIKYLVDNNINIWNKDAYNYYLEECKKGGIPGLDFDELLLAVRNNVPSSRLPYQFGDVGRNYGAQLRNWTPNIDHTAEWIKDIEGIDQLKDLIHTLNANPMATKKTVTFWNPAEADQTALTPCHWSFEILVEPLSYSERCKLAGYPNVTGLEKWLESVNHIQPQYQFDLKFHMHSVDTFLGLPFNLAFYGLLSQVIGKWTNMIPKGIIADLSNVHIYHPHLSVAIEQLSNDVNKYGKCELEPLDGFKMDMHGDIDQWLNSKEISDFKLKDYNSYPRIAAEMLPYSK